MIYRRDTIKDLSKIKLNKGTLLAKVIEKKSNILIVKDIKETTSPTDETFDYAIVVTVGPEVEDLNEGDIITDFTQSTGLMISEVPYLLINRLSINMAVSPENIDLDDTKINA